MSEDHHLARQAAAGSAAAFTALVRIHEGALRRFLARLTHGQGGDDLAQEVFVKAWRRAGDWRGEGSYRGWLFRIAWTSFLETRRARDRQEARDAIAFDQQNNRAPDPNAALDLQRALSGLTLPERAAALLCFGEGYTHVEAARIMDLPLGTLKSVVARARQGLIARLEDER